MADTIESAASEPPAAQHSWRSPTFIRVMLFIVPTVIMQGLVNYIVGLKTSFMLKEQLGIQPSALGTLYIVLLIPTYLQPFVGTWTDMFALFGYHRRSYYMAGKLLAAVGFAGLGVLEATGRIGGAHHIGYAGVVCLLFVIYSAGIMRTVIFNAIMVALGNITGRFGQLYSAISVIPIIMGITFASKLSGHVADFWSFQRAFFVGAMLTVLSVPLVFLIDEKRTSATRHHTETVEEYSKRVATKRAARHRTKALLRTALHSRSTWALVVFVFYLILTPGVNNTKLYFEQDSLHFSRSLIGSLGIYANWGALAGFFLYGAVSRKIPVFLLAWLAWLIDCVSYPILMGLHSRESAIVVEVLYNIISAVYSACLYTLAARMCPKGLEGVVYGLIASSIAFGGTLSEKIGGWLYELYGPASHFSLAHGWRYSCLFGFWFTVIAGVVIPFLPAWTRSHKRVGDLTDEDVSPGSGAAALDAYPEPE